MRIALLLLFASLVISVFAATNDVASVATSNTVMNGGKTNTVVQCRAITKSGTQCKRRSAPGKEFCRQHEKLYLKKTNSN